MINLAWWATAILIQFPARILFILDLLIVLECTP